MIFDPSDASACKMLGITVHPLTRDGLLEVIGDSVEHRRRRLITNHNLHSVYLFHRDAAMRDLYRRSSWTHIDGMSLVFLGRLLGLPVFREHRLTYLDWIGPLLAEAARRRWRVFFLGSRPGVAAKGASILQRQFPGLVLETADGYFDARRESTENRAILDRLNGFRPDLLLVGMGMPRQEHWILDNLKDIDAGAICTAGGMMDYIAGETATPPRWLGRIGLEWLFRLLSEPRRLWRRYLIEPWFVLRLFLTDFRRARFAARRGR